jgi:hypothetical protein
VSDASALPRDQLSLDPRFLRQAPRLGRAAERLSGLTLSAVEQLADRLATREYWLKIKRAFGGQCLKGLVLVFSDDVVRFNRFCFG